MLSRAQRLAILCGVATAHALLILLLPGSTPQPIAPAAPTASELELSLLEAPPHQASVQTTPPRSAAAQPSAVNETASAATAPNIVASSPAATVATPPHPAHAAVASSPAFNPPGQLVLNAKRLLAESLSSGGTTLAYRPARCPSADLPPRYPATARRFNQQGAVLIVLQIDMEGLVNQVELKQSSTYPLLDEAAIEQAKTWQCQPATQGGEAINSALQLRIVFRIEEL